MASIFLSWFFLSFFVASYARTKGLSGTLYFFCSLIFSPLLGGLAAIIDGKNIKSIAKLEKKKIKSGIFKRCPSCAEIVKQEAILCKFCQSNLIQEASSIQVTGDLLRRLSE